MQDKIVSRVVIEVLGKPEEHVDKAMKGYIERLKKDKRYKILREEFAEVKKQESGLWSTFTELEMEVENMQDLIGFCFDYMPSMLEVLTPSKIELSDKGFSDFFNDLQARLHQVDMIAKQVKMENDSLKINMGKLLRNYLTVLLGKGEQTLEQLGRLTGVAEEKLGDYMDKLIDEGLVKLEKEIYSLNPEKLKENK
jgi:hypothetical protein